MQNGVIQRCISLIGIVNLAFSSSVALLLLLGRSYGFPVEPRVTITGIDAFDYCILVYLSLLYFSLSLLFVITSEYPYISGNDSEKVASKKKGRLIHYLFGFLTLNGLPIIFTPFAMLVYFTTGEPWAEKSVVEGIFVVFIMALFLYGALILLSKGRGLFPSLSRKISL